MFRGNIAPLWLPKKQQKKVEKKRSPAKGGATKKSSPAKSGAVKKSAVMVEEFAVIFTGGKQYVVSVGDVITIEKLPGEHKEGDEIIFDKVDYESITNYLVKERSFSEDRIQSTLNRLKKALERKSQNLDQWF